VWLAGVNAWSGNAEEIIGDRTNGFAQLGLVSAVGGQIALGEYGRLDGRLSGVITTTQLGLDFAGSNFYDGETRSPSAMTLGDFYVRWNSGALVPTLGKDAIELSVGAQPYQIGPGDLGQGFLFWEGGKSGGRRGGLWLAMRNAFQLTGIARLDLKPCRCLPGLRFTGEMVKEKNGSKNDSLALWGELGHDFPDVPGSPFLSYRYAFFSGDDPGTEGDEAFDPLFYGLSDWNYWFIGEISGEWVTGNSNLHASIFRLGAHPTASLRTQFFWIYQRIDRLAGSETPPPGFDPGLLDVTSHNFSHEFNVIVDWAANEYLTTTFVGAALVPLKGGEQYFGSDKTWGQFMVYWSVAL